MFSRDSQFSRHNKAVRNAESDRDNSSSRHNGQLSPTKATHHSSPKVAPLLPSSPPASERLPIGTEAIEPAAERSLSWQVAPNLFISFKYAWAGISYAFTTQRNFRIHTGIGITAILLCWALKVSTVEVAVICLTIGAVLVMEILNTALESLVDLTVGQTYHDLAKIAKDCAAGAVLMAAIVAMLIAALIFVPPLWALLLR
ncbi:MAG: diacylglycerol kinase (ATP dependent) [Phormidesmis priestleyi Ana]|uniref:Diacylglycerol kinase (ATP dependent) n=1 Tax=Phormidesmis priestleyi Ana TaxID=1666911 RepID=A0A0P7YZA0_9CYAN|nr:MAG: diacylglycerol kinase (ATP dependent) [Phormidesmis priestleyi Ana]